MGNDEIKKLKSIKYYKDITNKNKNISNINDNLHEDVKLTFFINNCNLNSKYNFKVLGNNNQLLLSTKPISPKNNNELIFDNSLIITFYFEKEQQLLIEFYINNEKFIINITLGQIAGSRNNTFVYKFENLSEMLSIKLDKLEETKSYLNFQFNIKSNIPLDFSEPKNKICYLISNKTKLYSSEGLSDNATFNNIDIPINLLKPQFNITFYNFKKKIICEIFTTLEEFSNNTQNKNNEIKLNLSKKRTLFLTNKSFIFEQYTFIDYLKAGVRLGLSIGIDFTGSNGHPLDEDSLHRVAENYVNDYEKAIYSCGNILAFYDYDQLFPVYGFGAIINGSNNKDANMCFPINFNYENPYIYMISNIINVYHECLNQITFSGPTYFSPIINEVIKNIKSKRDNLEYHILMILTDGIINDMNETIDALVEGSFLPLSVVIIGIGNSNFGNMEQLDADDNPLISSKGVKRMRDLVQFVPFSKFQHDAQKLSEEVLEEIPRQITEYYSLNHLFPSNIQQ